MSCHLCLGLVLFLSLPLPAKVRVPAPSCGHIVSEVRAPWVCSAGGALLRRQDSLTGDVTTRCRGRTVAPGAHTPTARL